MGSKNKTVSFRVDEDSFESLREIADRRDLSLSAMFRDYVDSLVVNDGKVRVVSEDADGDEAFPPTVEVPKGFVREHERLELEARHLREQLQEHKEYIAHLREQLEDEEDVEDVLHLDDLDEGRDHDYEFDLEREPFR